MKNSFFIALILTSVLQTNSFAQILREDISLSDPFIMTDTQTGYYYMTGTGGGLWKSKDMQTWTGPTYNVSTSETTWMGSSPQIWASEIYRYNDRYYNISTFTNRNITIDSSGHPRRAVHITSSTIPDGTYTIIQGGDDTYLPAEKTTLDGTLFIDNDNKPYLLYCHEWIQNGNGTIEFIPLKDDLTGTIGSGTIIMRAKDASWNTGAVTDGPFVFRTQTGRLGIIWTSWHNDRYVQGVAYSTSGKLSGPWQQQALPITPDNYGHGMLFRDFNGKLLMCIHSHRTIDASIQKWERHPALFIMDDTGNELKTVMKYQEITDLQHPADVMVDNPEFVYGKNGWTSTTGAQNQLIASNQNGAITGNFYESWDKNSFIGEIYQTRNVPNGTYRITAAAFRSYPITGGQTDADVVKLFANDSKTSIDSANPAFFSVTTFVTDGKLRFGLRSEKKNYQWMGIDNVTIKYYGEQRYSEEEISNSDNRMYFRNIKTGKFINAGQSWGTKAVLNEHPLDFRILKLNSGRYAVDSKLSNGGGNHYMAGNGYLDGPMTEFRINIKEGNTCTLSHNGTLFWGATTAGNLATSFSNSNSQYAQWQMLSFNDLMDELNDASEESPVDATFLIQCPTFGRNDTRISAWNNGLELTRGGDVTNMCAQTPNTEYNIYQTLENIPNGIYQLKMQGFYRDGTAEVAANRKTNGNEQISAILYANDISKPIHSIFDEADSKYLTAANAQITAHGKIPASLEGASEVFSAGLYVNSLNVEVNDGKLTLGVRKNTANNPSDNWTVIDNFELTYLGKKTTGIYDIKNDDNYDKTKEIYNNHIYDLSGRVISKPLTTLPHGIYIINGKKIIL